LRPRRSWRKCSRRRSSTFRSRSPKSTTAAARSHTSCSYQLQIVDAKKPSNALVFKLEKTASGSVTKSFRIKVGKHTRRVAAKVDATDAVGNQSAFAKTFRLR